MNSVITDKVQRVIASCKTLEQMRVSKNYYKQALKTMSIRCKKVDRVDILSKEMSFYRTWFVCCSKIVWRQHDIR
jgi:hypothetical protein